MQYDSSWNALVNPGNSAKWFQGYDSMAAFSHTRNYEPKLAWLLCEISRLCYFDHQAHTKIFDHALARANLTLIQSLQTNALKCQLLRSQNAASDSFTILAFRGSTDIKNWLTNIQVNTTPWNDTATVHSGFYDAFHSLWALIQPHLSELAGTCYFTGHSLGAALATLAAAKHPPSALYHFGSPRVGNAAFAQYLEKNTPTFRIVQHSDIVTTLPWENKLSPFTHAGECHYFDHEHNHQMNPTRMEIFWNNLKRNFAWKDAFDIQKISTPAKALSDHSPINYTYALAHGM